MDKAEFIEVGIAARKSALLGTRARANFNEADVRAKLADRWDRENTPEAIAKDALLKKLEARGGKYWIALDRVSGMPTGGARMYFNSVKVAKNTFDDFYVDLETGKLIGGRTPEHRAAGLAAAGLSE
jgi:hypothetical protein